MKCYKEEMSLQTAQPKMQTLDAKKPHVRSHTVNWSESVICSNFTIFETYHFRI